jgi:acyl-coenzyme A thioesterase PaaI-like protein
MQGGAVATVIDAAAEAAIRSATAEPLLVTDLQVTYLALGRVGPIRTSVDVLGTNAGHARARVELVDSGAESRLTTLARVVATKSLRDR